MINQIIGLLWFVAFILAPYVLGAVKSTFDYESEDN